MSRTRTALRRTRGHWLPVHEAAVELMLAMKREDAAGTSAPVDSRPIGMCTGCGYLGYIEEIPSDARRHRRVQFCEDCRGVERKTARSEIAIVRRKRETA